jgi:L-ascorbate metabolism protein UlaG (beta-lactamase superfamily)
MISQMQQLTIIPNSLAFFGLGQMGIAIKGPDAVLYIDPCLSDVVREQFGDFWTRAYPPPVLPTDVTNATYYLVSHEHLDHLDTQTASGVAKASPQMKFVAPGWCKDIFAQIDIGDDRILYPQSLQPMTLPGTSAKLTAVPSAHYTNEYDMQKGHRWLGYIIEWNGVTFYHSGDTIIYEGYLDTLKKLPTPDVVMLPINGRDYVRDSRGIVGNLMPVEAANLAHDLHWDMVIAGHNDLYPNNTIPMGHIADAFSTVAPRQKYKILQPGELYYYVK